MYNIENIELNNGDIEKIFNRLNNFFRINPFKEIALYSFKLNTLVNVKYIYFSGMLYNEKEIYFTHKGKVYIHTLQDFFWNELKKYQIKLFNMNVPTITDYILNIYAERNFKNIQKQNSEILLETIEREYREKKNKKYNNISINTNIDINS